MKIFKLLFTSALVSAIFMISLTGTASAQDDTDKAGKLRKKLFVFNF